MKRIGLPCWVRPIHLLDSSKRRSNERRGLVKICERRVRWRIRVSYKQPIKKTQHWRVNFSHFNLDSATISRTKAMTGLSICRCHFVDREKKKKKMWQECQPNPSLGGRGEWRKKPTDAGKVKGMTSIRRSPRSAKSKSRMIPPMIWR